MKDISREGKEHIIVFQTTRFGWGRAALIFGIAWLIGLLFICIGAFVFFTTPFEHKKWSFFLFCLCAGLVMTFFNQKSSIWPPWIQIFELIGFCFLPATILHMSFIFPFHRDYHPRRLLYTKWTYAFSLVLFVAVRAFSFSFPGSPKILRLLVLFYFFLSILTFIIVLFYQYRKTPSRLTEMKIKVVLLGFFIGLFLPLTEPILNSLFGIFIFANNDLGHAALADFIQSPHTINFLFILAIVFFLNPITNSAQNIVNRLFYRRKYDYKESVKKFLKDITSIFKLDLIIERLLNILSNTMFIEDILLFLYHPDRNSYFIFNPLVMKNDTCTPLSIPDSNPLVKLLLEEKKEIHRDSFYEIPEYFHLREEILPLFESWKAQLIFPFITHNKLSGFISLGNMKSGRHYNISDTEFIKIITDQTAIALENVNSFKVRIEQEKIKEELKIASVIQKRMLPEASPQIKNISIHARIFPSMEIGGDFYDFITIPSREENGQGIVLGDVSGHGISGALLMSAAHSICHNQLLFQKDVTLMMEEANKLLIKETKKKAFVAMIMALLFPDNRMALVNAGLPSPLYYNHKRKEAYFLENEGERFPLGIVENPQYIPLTVSLETGDLILFYTDGIVEVKIRKFLAMIV